MNGNFDLDLLSSL